jgi:hypothetical protein
MNRRASMLSWLAILILTCLFAFGQTRPAVDFVSPPGSPLHVATAGVDATQISPQSLNTSLSGLVLSMPPGSADSSSIFSNSTFGLTGGNPNNNVGNLHNGISGGTTTGLATVPTFTGQWFAGAGPQSTGLKLWRYAMVGNDPAYGGTTHVPARIAEVSLQLLNADGSLFKTVPFSPFEALTLNSPNFANASYSSSPNPTQFADAVQRAEFFPTMVNNPPWHTLLDPIVVDRVTITVPRFVNVQLSNGTIIQARSYFTGTAADGSTFVLMLDLLFNFFFDNQVVTEIINGNFQTDSLNLTLFPNTFLFSLNVSNPNSPGGCCTLGFHTFFFEPGPVPQPRWLADFASWISPGLFGTGFQDVTAITHEISETINDPFLDNVTPSWQFPGQPANSKVCQNNLEVGDPVEVLANATTPVTVKVNGQSFTYHPQNLALLQWFEMGATSNALGGAFSFPNAAVLPHSAVPCPQ